MLLAGLKGSLGLMVYYFGALLYRHRPETAVDFRYGSISGARIADAGCPVYPHRADMLSLGPSYSQEASKGLLTSQCDGRLPNRLCPSP